MNDYDAFLDAKSHYSEMHGFEPLWMPSFLMDFQQSLVDWATRKGRGAIFADCGLGKTPMQLVWAENVVRRTGGRVLILTPLAVGAQTMREAEKFGIEAHRSWKGELPGNIIIANYERLHHFNAADFSGCVCDESSILKNYDGSYKAQITEFMRKMSYRLLCTATAAPNDYIEVGTSSEALGELGYMDMLNRFFKNDQNPTCDTKRKWAKTGGEVPKWRFKPHAETPFWQWVCSWARAVRKPSDIGFDNDGFILPPLIEKDHLVEAQKPRPGMLFALPAVGLWEQREERRHTINERCEKAAELSQTQESHLIWCHLNKEGDLLEQLIPGSIQVKGTDSDEWKEAAVEWFKGERCICNDPMFRAKLATCGKENIKKIGNKGSPQTQSTLQGSRDINHLELQKKTRCICEPITKPISTDGENVLKNSAIDITQNDVNNMRLTHQSEIRLGLTQNNGSNLIPTRDSISICENMGLLDKSIKRCSPIRMEDVQYVEAKTLEIEEGCDSTLTTVTPQELLEDCFVPTVTEDSGISMMTQENSKKQQCTCGYISGRRVLISKPVMFGFGLNLESCAHMTFFPSHSYEQYYQSVRRCWRFGQTSPVRVDVVTTEGEAQVMKNLQRKADAADKMFSQLVAFMNDAIKVNRDNQFINRQELPAWL